MKKLAMSLLLAIGGICLADEKVTVYQIDNAIKNGAHWEHSITNQMRVPEPDASALAKTLAEVGKEPPALLDILDLRCGVQIDSKIYVVTVLYHRGVEVQQATLADGKVRLKGESRVLGKLPEITKILQGYFYKMLDQDIELKRKQEAESGPREIPAKIDTEFRPEAGVEYTLAAPSLYQPARSSDPGPAARDTSVAWSFANEFVYRTALAKEYVVPAGQAGPTKDGWCQVGFTSKDEKSRLIVEVHIERRVARLRPQGGQSPAPANGAEPRR
jgi:hypothetical protein